MTQQAELSLQQKNLFQQGYQSYTVQQLKQIEWGLRFTPAACSAIAVYGLVTQNPLVLLFVAFLGMFAFFFPAGHPMDLIYNKAIAPLFNAAQLPPNPFQRRLACFSAGIMNTIAAGFFFVNMPMAALITGGLLLVLQAIVIFTHFCALSFMYEGVMRLLGQWHKPLAKSETDKLLASGAILIDVRGRDEFARQHLKTAQNFPLEEIDQHKDALESIGQALLYCASGTRSQIALQKLQSLGLDKVFDIGRMDTYAETVGVDALK